jgi:NADH:ubiquinone oxidoreductase subunit F (NADH-binding)
VNSPDPEGGPTVAAHAPRPEEAPERLLGGPPLTGGPESFASHRARLGDLSDIHPAALIEALAESGLLGRGGAAFPVATKWRSVAHRPRLPLARGRAFVVANGAEGEPRSAKDRALMSLRPHLVLDGAVLAARTVGADLAVVYVGTEHLAAVTAISRAIAERRAGHGVELRLVEAPTGYVAGESSAVVHYLDAGDARPLAVPPRPHEHGVAGRPTLIQNVETLAHVALIARYGAAWYRGVGSAGTPGSALVTVSGPVARPGVMEIAYGTTLRQVIDRAGGLLYPAPAVLLGGYFGGWASLETLLDLPLDPAVLREAGLAFGCGVIALLPANECGVAATERVMNWMAGESARQCGPCIYGLGAMADALDRLAAGAGSAGDGANLSRWADQVEGRGACHHPDGAVGLLRSGLAVFADEFALHERRACSAPRLAAGGH